MFFACNFYFNSIFKFFCLIFALPNFKCEKIDFERRKHININFQWDFWPCPRLEENEWKTGSKKHSHFNAHGIQFKSQLYSDNLAPKITKEYTLTNLNCKIANLLNLNIFALLTKKRLVSIVFYNLDLITNLELRAITRKLG